MKKALFIDRDGTLIVEPPVDRQVDSLEKLRLRTGRHLGVARAVGTGFRTGTGHQPGRAGHAVVPEATFRPAHERMLATLEGEGVRFDDQLIDRTFEADDAPTRKPRTGMFGRYLDGSYDLAASYVVGDRPTDMLLARNLGARGILLAPDEEAGRRALREAGAEAACALVAPSWERIAEFIRRGERSVTLTRRTAETQITLTLDLDGRSGAGRIASGIGFFDHMLAQIAHHGGVALSVEATGDLWVDEHHTVEDVGIVLGEAVDRALGSKAGIARYGFVLPMDDCRAMALIDFGGRIGFEWEAEFRRERIGELPTEMLRHFFHSFACAARCNLHVAARGDERAPQGRSDLQGLRTGAAHGRGPHPLRLRYSQQQRSPMTAIIDYDTGNLRSVAEALRRAGAEFTVTADPATLLPSRAGDPAGRGRSVVGNGQTPGKGARHARSRADAARAGHLHRDAAALPVERGGRRCAVWASFPPTWCGFPTRTADGPLKVPHMGWDTVDMLRGPLFEGIDAQTYVYYVHSYAPRLCDAAIATTDYGVRFSAALARDNFFGTQFHPEKSGAAGSADSTQLPNTEMR